jgi:hypothetical protein
MTCKKIFIASLCFVILVMLVFPFWSQAKVEKGDSFVGLEFPAPGTEEAMQYFGLDKNESFGLDQLEKEYVLFKVVDVYCSVCHRAAFAFNRLYLFIQEDTSLADKLCLFIVAPEATPTEVGYLYQSWETPYPILGDFEDILPAKIASLITPYTILADREGRVLYAHYGPTPNTREMIRQLKEILGN